MKKTPEGGGEFEPEGEEHVEDLREDLRKKGLTESQIDDMLIRLNAEEFFKSGRPRKEPEFFYQVFEEKLRRPLTDLEKIQIKADLDRSWDDLKKQFGVDDEGKLKKD